MPARKTPPTTYVALLRGINVGGHNSVAMADLRALCTGLRLSEPRSLLVSGNLVFGAAGAETAALEDRLEAECEKRLGLRTELFVRTAAQWREIVARNPFPEEARADPGHLLVMFLKSAPGAARVKALQAAIAGPERLRARGREAYFVYPDGMGRSKLTSTRIEKALGTSGTLRNWNTVAKLAALVGA